MNHTILRQTFPSPVPGFVVNIEIRFDAPDRARAAITNARDLHLFFRYGKLLDWTGAFFLPREVGHMLRQAGYLVGDDCFA